MNTQNTFNNNLPVVLWQVDCAYDIAKTLSDIGNFVIKNFGKILIGIGFVFLLWYFTKKAFK